MSSTACHFPVVYGSVDELLAGLRSGPRRTPHHGTTRYSDSRLRGRQRRRRAAAPTRGPFRSEYSRAGAVAADLLLEVRFRGHRVRGGLFAATVRSPSGMIAYSLLPDCRQRRTSTDARHRSQCRWLTKTILRQVAQSTGWHGSAITTDEGLTSINRPAR
jgi:hypothetical protein